MKKFIYFLCCVISVCCFVYMTYLLVLEINAEHYNIRTLMSAMGTLGWGIVTFKITTRDYKWAAYLCK